MEQLRAMRRTLAQQRGGGDHLAGPANEGRGGAIDANGFPSGGQPSASGSGGYPPQTGGYPATGSHPSLRGDQGGYGVPGRPPQSMTGPQQAYSAGTGPQQSFTSGTGPQQSFANGTGPQRSFAEDGRQGHAPPRGGRPQDPRFPGGNDPGYGGANDANPTYGTSTATDAASHGGVGSYGGAPPTGPAHEAGFGTSGYHESRPGHGYPQQTPSVPHTVDEAVHVAHREGNDFAESIAREAPALWVEAVLARRPRMPSDLEARLLQGSSLPIDHLLRDEVRDGLRQGFWQALERARR
jgi:hypothetical protein